MNVGTLWTKLLRDDGRLVDVDLDDFDLARLLSREGFDVGRDRFARLAPVGGKLHEDRELAPQNFGLEVALRHVGHAARAFAARSAVLLCAAAVTAEATEDGHAASYLYARLGGRRGGGV
jgi:hypothetical protein